MIYRATRDIYFNYLTHSAFPWVCDRLKKRGMHIYIYKYYFVSVKKCKGKIPAESCFCYCVFRWRDLMDFHDTRALRARTGFLSGINYGTISQDRRGRGVTFVATSDGK